MSKCDRSERALKVLDGISEGITSLKDLVRESPGEDEKPKEENIRKKAETIADKIFWMPSDERLGRRSDLIEALVREEVEACAEVAENHCAYVSCGLETANKIRKRLSR